MWESDDLEGWTVLVDGEEVANPWRANVFDGWVEVKDGDTFHPPGFKLKRLEGRVELVNRDTGAVVRRL